MSTKLGMKPGLEPGLFFLMLMLVAAVIATTSCAHRRAEPQAARAGHVAGAHDDWVKLGERRVDGVRDRDVIAVSRGDRYRRIMIVVEQSALEMHDVVVNFGDGTSFSPPTRHVFSANTRSHVIDLPGAQRVIRNVEFRYGNLPGGGAAQAELWAQ